MFVLREQKMQFSTVRSNSELHVREMELCLDIIQFRNWTLQL